MPDVKEVYDMVTQQTPPKPDALERQRKRQKRHAMNRKLGGFAVAAAIAGLALLAIWVAAQDGGQQPATPGTIGTSVAPSATTETVAPEYPGRIGIVGLPAEDAIPSSPTRGELVVSVGFGHSGGDPGRFNLDVYEDGRLIWQKLGDASANRPSTGLIEQRLTQEGVELIRSEVLSIGLLDRDRHLVGGYLPYSGNIEVRDGDRLVQVTWGDIMPAGPDTRATPEQANALEQLDARLEDLASWLPASAWEDQELKAYVAARYSVCYEAEQNIGLDRVLGSLPRPVEDALRPLERTHGEYGGGFDYWCSAVTTERARALAEVLDGAGFSSNGGDVFGLAYRTSDRGAVRVSISFEPLLPHLG